METLQMDLNPQQQQAVEHFEGPLLVLAGAGSGKTRVVTYRIVRLLERGVPASQILGVTFTNKAAQEMRERVEQLTNARVLISTFHSLGARILRESISTMGYSHGFSIYDEDDSNRLLKACLEELRLKDAAKQAKALRTMISNAKNALESPEDTKQWEASTDLERDFPEVYDLYQKKLKSCNAVDFDDLLYLTVKLFREHPGALAHYRKRWSFFLVDEYQDTNGAQYEMIRLLTQGQANLCAVGDPDQSIYSWRGAKVRNILNFGEDFPGATIVRLEQNYRSTQTILEAANSVIEHNPNRYEKNLWSDLGVGDKISLYEAWDEREEADFVVDSIEAYHKQGVPFQEMVIFYRTNFQSRVFEDRLLRRRLPYVIVGGVSFYQRKEIKDILAYLRVVHSDADYIAFARTVNMPKRGIGATTLTKIRQAAEAHQMPVVAFCEKLLKEPKLLSLGGKAKAGLTDYIDMIQQLRKISGLSQLVKETLSLSGYQMVLMEDPESMSDRRDNIYELIAKAEEWEEDRDEASLSDFLEELSLRSSLDSDGVGSNSVHLMTAHNGKGLEFDLVFMVGMEQDLFPHANSRGSFEAFEEERRLCYVGMTRARKWLYMTHARERRIWGGHRSMQPSRFLKEIEPEYVMDVSNTAASSSTSEWDTDSFLEASPSKPKQGSSSGIAEGDVVMHEDFGIGTVLKAFEGSLGLTYEVYFQNDESKKFLVAKYAKLEKL